MRESKNNERHLANIFRSNRLIFVYSVFLALQAGILFLGRQKRSSSGIEFKGAACNSTQNDKVFTGVHQTTHLGSGNATSEKVLVISGHEGTNRDFQYVADEIGLDASYEKPNPFVEYQPMFQITHDRAMAHWERHGRLYCTLFDYIIIIDTIPVGGRPFFEAFHKNDSILHNCRFKKVILLITNRFDFANGGEEYLSTVRSVAFSTRKLQWIANNPFEEFHMKIKGVKPPKPLPIIRPHGVVPVSVDYAAVSAPDPEKLMVMLYSDSFKNIVAKLVTSVLENLNIPYVQAINRSYGGPKNLAKFKAAVLFPYQVSIMVFYEGLANGVIWMLPSVKLMQKWCEDVPEYRAEAGWLATQACPENNEHFPWHLVEYYNPYFDKLVLKYDSVEEIPSILTTDLDKLREKAVSFMTEHKKQTIEQWRTVFFDG